MRGTIGIAGLALVATACVTAREGAPASAIGEWRVIAINGAPVAGPAFAATFTHQDGTAQFGCNRGGGPVRARLGRLDPGEWVITAAGCLPRERMRYERAGFDVLGQPMRVSRTSVGIRLTSSAGSIDLAP